MLNRRQRALYKHKCDIWSVTRTIAQPSNKPGGETYTLIATDVPVLYELTPNVDVETAAGRVKEFTLLTTDKIHMEASAPVQDGFIVVNRTTLADGRQVRGYNEAHRVLGQPEVHETLGRRKANKLMVEAMSVEHPPAAIRDYYGS